MANFNPYVDIIDVSFWRELCTREGTLRRYRKGEMFLHAGEIPKFFGFIESGYFIYSVIDTDGVEHVTGFALRGNLAGDFYSSVYAVPALNNLKATANSSVWVISLLTVQKVFGRYPDMRLIMAEELFRTAHQRYVDHYRHSPKERYIEVLNRCPDLLQHITLKELASYLQITPTHLSRIRKEILSGT